MNLTPATGQVYGNQFNQVRHQSSSVRFGNPGKDDLMSINNAVEAVEKDTATFQKPQQPPSKPTKALMPGSKFPTLPNGLPDYTSLLKEKIYGSK